MSDVQEETLQELVERRLYELGAMRGRGSARSLRETYVEYVDGLEGEDPPFSYETARQVAKGIHSNISDRTALGLADMLGISVNDVLQAIGRRPRLGRFSLPPRADGLDDRERKVVLAVVDAILTAHEDTRATRRGRGLGARMTEVAERAQAEYDAERTPPARHAEEGAGA